jgi:hypothetical protein
MPRRRPSTDLPVFLPDFIKRLPNYVALVDICNLEHGKLS